MKYNLVFTLAFLFQIVLLKNSCAQNNNGKLSTISFFIECEDCDFTFVRQELPFVSFVRDPKVADVHILTSESNTGSGGKIYYLNFIGKKEFENLNYDYSVKTKQSDTDDDIRKSLLKLIKIGILPYFAKTDILDQLNIKLEESENLKAADMVTDPWNKLVFTIESGGDFQKEESQNEYSINTNAGIRKLTEDWKTSFEGSYEINREKFFDQGNEITNRQDTKELDADFIKSLTGKWSAGAFGSYSSRTFLNIKHNYDIAVGMEYNFFPWIECNRRVFSIGYHAGISYFDYKEETIYEKFNETLLTEALRINLDLLQPWGEISLELEGQHYFHDFSKNRLTFESDFSLRITKNLSVYSEIQSNIIHDQLYLPISDASLEDILLKRRKIATTYEISGEIGLRFTFGSIYNNVVNERF